MLLFSERLKAEEDFKNYIKANPKIANCPMNFLAWLETSPEGKEIIKKISERPFDSRYRFC